MNSLALAIDVGGTFTDVVLCHRDGRIWTDKTLTTHDDLLEGFFAAADGVMRQAGVRPEDIDDVIVHATTVVTNALIERKGPPTALVVTEGFRDVLYIREEHRYDMYDPQIEYPEPLVPRELTFAAKERVYADGTVGRTLSERDAEALVREVADSGAVSVAVCLLNAYKNPENEQRLREAFERLAPSLYVSLSSEVAPQIREYLRASTTAINAYTEPITRPYVEALSEQLDKRGFPHEPMIMLSSGGVIGARLAGRFPVRMIESGPAAGALVAKYFAEKLGLKDLLSFDMGGTTAKACLIQGGEPLVSNGFEVDRRYRFKPGSGMPVTVPSIDMIEIGAGGGSIARVDALGLLKTGPDSAGSQPGPICYGRGGTAPTVTDADLVAGILGAENFLGGAMRLDLEAAVSALTDLGARLGVSPVKAATGVYAVVGESMAAAARAHATDRGIDYRGMPLLAFGGAGPMHACYVAELLDSPTVIFPPLASVLSAFGTLVTPSRLDLVHGQLTRLDDIDWEEVERVVSGMCAEGHRGLEAAGVSADHVGFEFAADMRYAGQQSEVTVALPCHPSEERDTAALRQRFEQAYQLLYEVRLDDMSVEIVSWQVTAVSHTPARTIRPPGKRGSASPKTWRQLHLPSGSYEAPVYDRSALSTGETIAGPVLIEEAQTTCLVPQGWTVSIDEIGCLVARR